MRQLYFILGFLLGGVTMYLLLTPAKPAPLDETTQAYWRRPASRTA